MRSLPLLCLALLPVVAGTAADPEPAPAHLTWERMIDKTAEEHQVFVSQATTMSLDGIYTWVPSLTDTPEPVICLMSSPKYCLPQMRW